MLVDARGVPLSIVVTGANRHDVTQIKAVLDERFVCQKEAQIENLCADAGYVGQEAERTMRESGYVPHVRSRGEEKKDKANNPGFRARRWVVEACHSWLNRFRKLLVRYEKKVSSHLALCHLACAIIALRKAGIIYG